MEKENWRWNIQNQGWRLYIEWDKGLFSKHNIKQENQYQQSLKNWNDNYKLKPNESRDLIRERSFSTRKNLLRKRKEIL